MKQLKFLKLSLVVILFVITGCNDTTPLSSETEDNISDMPELAIEFDSKSYRIGDPIPITITLRNNGKESILVNGRMAANLSSSPEKFREIVFTIQSPSGKELDPAKLITTRSPEDKEFVLLESGAEVERVIDLNKIYKFMVSGEYSIQATYQNTADPSDGRIAWKGQVVSNQVTFTLDQ